MKKSKIITICASGPHYKQVIQIKNQLKDMRYEVFVPRTAKKMEKSGDYDIVKHKTWYKDTKRYREKTAKMKGHFRQIDKGDVILVTNYTKRGIKGYIGGNVLLEIFYAWLQKKRIYILNQLSDKCTVKEEVLGMNPIIINGDLTKIFLNKLP